MKSLVTGFFIFILIAGSSLAFACKTCGCQGGGAAHSHDSAAVSEETPQTADAPVTDGKKICPITGKPLE